MSMISVFGVRSFKALIPYILLLITGLYIGYLKLTMDKLEEREDNLSRQVRVVESELLSSINQNEILKATIDRQNAEMKRLAKLGKDVAKAVKNFETTEKKRSEEFNKVLNMKAKTCPQIKEKLKAIGGISYESL